MPTDALIVRGDEVGSILLEDDANFLRDLIFLHNRIWILASRDESLYKLYYSNWFYVRGKGRVPEGQELSLISARIGSPFELNLNLNGKRLTNAPVRQARSVLKCLDDRENRVVIAQATYTSGGSAVSG